MPERVAYRRCRSRQDRHGDYVFLAEPQGGCSGSEHHRFDRRNRGKRQCAGCWKSPPAANKRGANARLTRAQAKRITAQLSAIHQQSRGTYGGPAHPGRTSWHPLDNVVRGGLCLCARFAQSFLVIASARTVATFINRNNRSALGTQMQMHSGSLTDGRYCMAECHNSGGLGT